MDMSMNIYKSLWKMNTNEEIDQQIENLKKRQGTRTDLNLVVKLPLSKNLRTYGLY